MGWAGEFIVASPTSPLMAFKGGNMRRKELEVKDQKSLKEVLDKAEIGYLAFNGPDGWPRVTPLNFIFDGRILWHGAVGGERFECLKRDPRATFMAVSLQRYIPSHFISESAANASVAFKSVSARGRCMIVEDPEERCAILNKLMDKYQPEGKYVPLTPENPLYTKVLKGTGVFAFSPEEITGKFKLLNGKSEADRRAIAAKLREAGTPLDTLVAAEILKSIA